MSRCADALAACLVCISATINISKSKVFFLEIKRSSHSSNLGSVLAVFSDTFTLIENSHLQGSERPKLSVGTLARILN